jgi:sulfate transport system ATP-binding protein
MNQGRIEQIGTPEEVYERPANPFVFNFLGSVNLFHGRAHEGSVRLGPLDVAAPEHAQTQDAPAVGYVRPHDIDVQRQRNGAATIEATVRHISAVGPVVRLELERHDNGDVLQAELTRERYQEMGLRAGEHVHVKPRKLQVFLEESDYSI